MVLKRWGSLILLLTIILSACGAADTADVAISQTGLESTTTPDSPYPVVPTEEPVVTATVEPTVEPTIEPTVEPTIEPTVEPTVEPTTEPTIESTQPDHYINMDMLTKNNTMDLSLMPIYTYESNAKINPLIWTEDEKYLFFTEGDYVDINKTYVLDTESLSIIATFDFMEKALFDPASKDIIFLRSATNGLNNKIDGYLWKYESPTIIQKTFTASFNPKRDNPQWTKLYGLTFIEENTNSLKHINSKKQVIPLTLDIPNLPDYISEQYTTTPFLSSNSESMYIFSEDKQNNSTFRIDIVNKSNVNQTLSITNPRIEHSWSTKGKYISIAPHQDLNTIDIYSIQGEHTYRIHASPSIKINAWNPTETQVILTYYDNGRTRPMGNMILDLTTQEFFLLPSRESSYTSLGSTYLWSPQETTIVGVASVGIPFNQKETTEESSSVLTMYRIGGTK